MSPTHILSEISQALVFILIDYNACMTIYNLIIGSTFSHFSIVSSVLAAPVAEVLRAGGRLIACL